MANLVSDRGRRNISARIKSTLTNRSVTDTRRSCPASGARTYRPLQREVRFFQMFAIGMDTGILADGNR